MKRRPFKLAVPLAAAALAGAMLPLTTGGPSYGQALPGGAAEPAFTGFSSEAWSSPLEVEIYEPTIPIPATPQAELLFGYTAAEADSGSAKGRASYAWPGDPVGEGFKTIAEAIGLPPEISEGGYPIQVNSNYPSGPEFEADEPVPGAVQRTGAGEFEVYAENAYSTDCSAGEPAGEGDGGDDGDGGGDDGGGGIPGLPDIPGLPTVNDSLTTSALFGGSSAAAPTARTSSSSSSEGAVEEPPACPIPAELAALVDLGSYVSTSKNSHREDLVFSTSRASASDIAIAGGVVVIEAVRAKAIAKSDGAKGVAEGTAAYGALTIGGQEFTLGPDGVEASGQGGPIPGLPDDPEKALAELGISLTIPKPSYETDGDVATARVVGLIVEIDSATLAAALDQTPLDDVIGELPDDLGQLKSLVQAAANLSPRYVFNLAVATSTVDTAQGIEIPPIEPPAEEEPAEEDGEEETDDADGGGGDTGSGGGQTGGSAAPPAPAPPGGAAAGGSPSAPPLTGAAATAGGLPALFSIPGALLFGGIAGGVLAGSYMRRLGLLALGGGPACAHGLDSGLPDLRKA